jgi:hypothetical protein
LTGACDVIVTGWTSAPIPWPLCRPLGVPRPHPGLAAGEHPGLAAADAEATKAGPDAGETGQRFRPRHGITPAVIALLIAGVLLFGMHVGAAAFAGAVVLTLLRLSDRGEAVRKMPGGVIGPHSRRTFSYPSGVLVQARRSRAVPCHRSSSSQLSGRTSGPPRHLGRPAGGPKPGGCGRPELVVYLEAPVEHPGRARPPLRVGSTEE